MSEPAPIGDLVGPVIRDLARRSGKDLNRWFQQVDRLHGCSAPVRLVGDVSTVDPATGEVLHHYSTSGEPHGQLLVRCGNRRASRCPACAETYRADTFHLIRAGLLGGDKGVPATVSTHPRVLATFTAPSFGPVHRGPDKHGQADVCHPRRKDPACFERHGSGDRRIGQALDPDSYDYAGHVLWNAHAGMLWHRFGIYLRRHLGASAGLTRSEFSRRVRLSFAKVAEYQARGSVHFHAVIRLDGRTSEGKVSTPPAWASVELLSEAIASSAGAVHLDVPDPYGGAMRDLCWGAVDVRHIETAGPDGVALSEAAVAGYVAKYATKAAETSGTLDRRIRHSDLARLEQYGVTEHAARLIRTAWELGNPTAYPDLAPLRLRQWAHMLGFRGHFSTKSRAYSTTLTALRHVRLEYRQARDLARLPYDPATTLVLANWKYAGQGYTAGESALVSTISPKGGSVEH
ncbi:replication initiation protein [Planobispora rosea]|uniref:Replication initiation protein n=1 Tax=Planobispora rosea TaxID=35762 RepID=A0A8J3WGX3_PLARO|nr:replication initiator [Planobispora rosea]GGT00676.1 replication initiation protein [Planobispora rosea]GIH88172.1 replication initiation protein [Planobispora rosea]